VSNKQGIEHVFTCRRATLADVDALAPLFDAYRQFYDCDPDEPAASAWLRQNLEQHRAVIFLAERTLSPRADGVDSQSTPVIGFTQLYPALCSVDLKPYFVLYDLFVMGESRNQGVALALMATTAQFARREGAARLDLETAHTNKTAQRLYEKLGYEADKQFQKYSLALT
jgi:ribosomal protein S18 acetylase RimI-like enzyme